MDGFQILIIFICYAEKRLQYKLEGCYLIYDVNYKVKTFI